MRPNGVVVCATDLSEGSTTVIDTAVDIAERFAASKLMLVHVHEGMERYDTVQEMVERFEAEKREVRALVDRELQRMRERLANTSVQISAEICVGKPYREIIEFALRANAMALVVGTHVRADADNAVLGSVAERVVRYAHCTVVVAKSEDFFEHLRQSRG